MDPSCNWCGDDLHLGAHHVVITKGDDPEPLKELILCKKCVKALIEK